MEVGTRHRVATSEEKLYRRGNADKEKTVLFLSGALSELIRSETPAVVILTEGDRAAQTAAGSDTQTSQAYEAQRPALEPSPQEPPTKRPRDDRHDKRKLRKTLISFNPEFHRLHKKRIGCPMSGSRSVNYIHQTL